jgi:hypothetical protein
MKISGNSAEIERNDLLQENSFKIKATGKAFQILSDGLYADKIKAVIRELSCNAYDAHIAAGNANEPFTVHLPNALEPYFSVRDYGIGLSVEAVMHIFTTYFESLKNDSNDFIGGLGLGSKSPFSYVDAFTVISRFNGKKYSYTAFIGEDDTPKIAMLNEEDTTEGNGLEVSMPVRSADFREFDTKARAVLSRFNPQPKITGVGGFEFDKREVLLEGTNWRLLNKFAHDRYGYNSRDTTIACAVQGNIAYPLAASSLGDLKREYQSILNYPFEFDFQIGDLEIAASREALGYKKNTIANVVKAMDAMFKELPSKFADRFKNAKTAWEARVIWGDLFNGQSNLSYLLRELANQNKLTFKVGNDMISTNQAEVKYEKVKSAVITRFASYYHGTSKYVAATMNANTRFTVQANKDVEFFINDLPRGHLVRLRPYAKAGGHASQKMVYLLEGEDADIQLMLHELGNPPTRKTSELDKPVRAANARKVTSNVLTDNQWGGLSWKEQEFDADEDEGYFVHYLRDRPVENEKAIEGFDQIITAARSLKILSKKDMILGVVARVRDKLDKHENWVALMPYLKEQVEKKLASTPGLADDIATVKQFQEFTNNNYYGRRIIDALAGKVSQLDAKSPFVKFITNFEKLKTNQSVKASELQTVASLLNMELPTSNNSFEFNKEYADLLKLYPLLSLLQSFSFSEAQVKHLIQYINLMHK